MRVRRSPGGRMKMPLLRLRRESRRVVGRQVGLSPRGFLIAGPVAGEAWLSRVWTLIDASADANVRIGWVLTRFDDASAEGYAAGQPLFDRWQPTAEFPHGAELMRLGSEETKVWDLEPWIWLEGGPWYVIVSVLPTGSQQVRVWMEIGTTRERVELVECGSGVVPGATGWMDRA